MEVSRHILIVDAEENFLESFALCPDVKGMRPLVTTNAISAQELIDDPHLSISGIFVGYNLPNTGWLKVIMACHMTRPGVPIFTLESGDPTETNRVANFEGASFDQLGIRKCLGRKIDFEALVNSVAPLVVGFDVQGALKKAKKNTDQLGDLSQSAEKDFVGIRADNFLSGTKSLFDLYVKLSSQKYIKIAQAGHIFDVERVNNYLKRGVTHFFIKKEVQKTYLDYCAHLTKRILESNLPDNVKVAQTLNFGQQTMGFIKENGVGPEEFLRAQGFVGDVYTLFQKFDPKKCDVLGPFLNEIGAYDHGVSTIMLATLIAEPLGLNTEYAVEKIGLSALLHDIGLVGMSRVAIDEDESKMSLSQKTTYRTHPTLGAEKLRELPEISPVVVEAVAHHHVRKGTLGFPITAKYNEISKVAQIIGMADEFSRLITQSFRHENVDPFQRMEEDVFPGFSSEMINAFKKAFNRQ